MAKHVLRVRRNGVWHTGEYSLPEFLARYMVATRELPSEDVEVNPAK